MSRWPDTLFARVSVAFLAIIFLTGGGFWLVDRFNTRVYYEELTQRLNGSIAMYVVGERTLIENGVVNEEALAVLGQQAMVINPTVEIYLLDPEGRILGHALPPDTVLTERVDVQPIRQMLDGVGDTALQGYRSTKPRR